MYTFDKQADSVCAIIIHNFLLYFLTAIRCMIWFKEEKKNDNLNVGESLLV